MATTGALLKRIVVGRPMATHELSETLLPKYLALPIFSSDPLSSVAYATQEILLVLGAAGAAALTHAIPISLAIALLLATVVVSYRQVCVAYPEGGGSYMVSKINVGRYAGLLAASGLMVDYVMTVAVSTVAGVDAIVSAAPSLGPLEVPISLGVIAAVTLANLRGVRESGRLFALPTYVFVVMVLLTIVVGAARCASGCPLAPSHSLPLHATETLGWYVLLRAFSGGTSALTGTEAISNGVPAFRYSQSRNAADTLAIMGAIAITMFVGISVLTVLLHVHFTGSSSQTVLAQVGATVLGRGFLFYLLQASTALILMLAANTAFNGLPRLEAVLARDRFLPRHFLNLGDRLVYSNGIVILAVVAGLLVWVFQADTNRLIQLYLVGVFIAFTLSQLGLVRHWRAVRGPGWKRRAAINGFGGILTGIVLAVVLITKFTEGAWLVVLAIPGLILLMDRINRHLTDVAAQLQDESRRPPRGRGRHRVVVFVERVDAGAIRALAYVRSLRIPDMSAVTCDPLNAATWERVAPDIPLTVLDDGAPVETVTRHLARVRPTMRPEDHLTLVVPEVLPGHGLMAAARKLPLQRLKAAALRHPGVAVLDLPLQRTEVKPDVAEHIEPAEHHVVVLTAGVNNATLRALDYAASFQATSLRAVNFGLDPDEAARLGDDWLAAGVPYVLELEDSPFRDIGSAIVHYVRRFDPDGHRSIVTVVVPEFIVPRVRHRLLHGQTPLIIKRHLLFERGVAVAGVPYHLDGSSDRSHRGERAARAASA